MTGLPDPALPDIRGTTRLVGIIGWPVSDSLSPVIHNAAFRALGLDWAYVPLPVPPGRLAEAVWGLPALGFAGANVTMPHKEEAGRRASSLSDDAARLRAVNTLVAEGRRLAGHNTDAPGFARFLSEDVGFDPAGRSAVVLGAGGAARACAWAMAQGGLRSLAVAVRGPDRAAVLIRALAGTGVEATVVGMEEAAEVHADLVLNATPLGGAGELPPHPPLGPGVVVVDLRYRPAVTPLMGAARQAGAAAFGGLGLLLHQAALSLQLWTGRLPPMEAMSAAAMAALAKPH